MINFSSSINPTLPTAAIVFYKNMAVFVEYSDDGSYKTIPTTTESITDLLSKYRQRFLSPILPPNVISYGERNQCSIFIPPKKREVSVMGRWINIPLPGFIFSYSGDTEGGYGSFSIVAVKQKTREQLWKDSTIGDVALYLAPLANTGSNNICFGSVNVPDGGMSAINDAAEAYFTSNFNTHSVSGKCKKYPESINHLLIELHESGAEEFPLDELIQARRWG